MLCGVDQLFNGQLSALRRRLRGSRLGVLTHAAAVDRRGRHLLSVLEELGASPRLIFAPEHGLDATAQAEEAVSSEAREGQTPIVSLYGKTKEALTPAAEQLAEIDLLLIDLADVGSRYYTYAWTALLAARAASAASIHTVVLDRPNPISGDPKSLEGAPQQDGFLSFVGLEALPIRHALSIGELLAMFMERGGKALGAEGALSVVSMLGWERHRGAEAWGRPFVLPSPNMPTAETALVYPGGCLLEGTNLSEGRGTTRPFEIVGAPWIDGEALARDLARTGLPGFVARPVSFVPMFHKHAGRACGGVQIHVRERSRFRPYATYLALLAIARRLGGEAFAFRTEPYEFVDDIPALDLLTGSAEARTRIAALDDPRAIA